MLLLKIVVVDGLECFLLGPVFGEVFVEDVLEDGSLGVVIPELL